MIERRVAHYGALPRPVSYPPSTCQRGSVALHPAYFEARFRTPEHVARWPDRFAIISAHATTGSSWTDEANEEADRRLAAALRERSARAGASGAWLQRITGYSPTTGHAEPSWAAPLPFDEACDLGRAFRQDAVYFVRGDELFVSHCDERRALVPVGSFRARLDG